MSRGRLRLALVGLLVMVGACLAWAGGSDKEESAESMEPLAQQMAGQTDELDTSRYRPYSESGFASASDQVRVYFFHASWCPTCKAAHRQFTENQSQIPEGVVVFQIDYDSNGPLKRKFGVTYQHTFVVVDSAGNPIRLWNGGDVQQVIANTSDLL